MANRTSGEHNHANASPTLAPATIIPLDDAPTNQPTTTQPTIQPEVASHEMSSAVLNVLAPAEQHDATALGSGTLSDIDDFSISIALESPAVAPGPSMLGLSNMSSRPPMAHHAYRTIPLPTVDSPEQETTSTASPQTVVVEGLGLSVEAELQSPQTPPGPPSYVAAAPPPAHLPASLPSQPAWEVPQYLARTQNVKIQRPIGVGKFLTILEHCAALETFTVTIDDSAPSNVAFPTQVVIAPNLTRLQIATTCNLQGLLRGFSAPKLKVLDIKWESADGETLPPPNAVDGLVGFLSRSSCPLKALVLHDMYPEERQLLGCLSLQKIGRTLEALTVQSNSNWLHLAPHNMSGRLITDITIAALGQADETQSIIFCPEIRTLELSPCCTTDGSLSVMVSKRVRGPTFYPLSLCYAFGNPALHPLDTYALEALRHKERVTIVEGTQYTIAQI
ncbi:hypothetical protein H0H92_005894 [Tricholoma furcatifolium]|nr:hypothetical protein H0H92_005894 [Tricholoma furcatifolium]